MTPERKLERDYAPCDKCGSQRPISVMDSWRIVDASGTHTVRTAMTCMDSEWCEQTRDEKARQMRKEFSHE